MNLRTAAFVPVLLLALAAVRLASIGPRPADERLALAERYVRAYAALDLDALAEHWTEGTVWQDPTGGEIGASTEPVEGPAAIRAHLLAATAGVRDLRFDLPERFASGDHVVSTGTMSYDLVLGRPDGSELRVPFEMRVVIVLRIEGGKVVRHTDYTDFSTWQEQYATGLTGAQSPR